MLASSSRRSQTNTFIQFYLCISHLYPQLQSGRHQTIISFILLGSSSPLSPSPNGIHFLSSYFTLLDSTSVASSTPTWTRLVLTLKCPSTLITSPSLFLVKVHTNFTSCEKLSLTFLLPSLLFLSFFFFLPLSLPSFLEHSGHITVCLCSRQRQRAMFCPTSGFPTLPLATAYGARSEL